MASQLEKLAYEVKYTAGSYLDSLMSIPIWFGEKILKSSQRVLRKNNHDFLNPDDIMKNSPLYKKRQNMRDSLDTRPGALYVQSNIVAMVPFFLVGMPAAEAAAGVIENAVPEASELSKNIGISLSTLACQMATIYAAFTMSEARVNKQKYLNENGKLSMKKIGKMSWNTVKTFWKFDLSYITAKTALQTAYLLNDQDPWEASAIADALALPAWYTVAIALGLRGGLIETKKTEELYRKKLNKQTNN